MLYWACCQLEQKVKKIEGLTKPRNEADIRAHSNFMHGYVLQIEVLGFDAQNLSPPSVTS